MGRQRSQALLIRVPNRPTARATDTGADFVRALHRQLPVATVWLGQAPWLSLTWSARPDEPVELGIVVAGGTATKRASWVAAIRKTIQGLAPEAVVATRPDPLADAMTPGRVAAWAEWRLALAPSYPLRLHDDQQAGDLVGPLVAALQPRQGVVATEVQLSIRPRPDDSHLARGWRAAGIRRLLRLMGKHEYALTPDARALEAKLAGPVYDATLRAVAVAADPAHGAQARAELDEVNAVIGQYAARSGSRLQRWVRRAGGTIRVPQRPAWMQGIAGGALALVIGGLVGLSVWPWMATQPLVVVGLSLVITTISGRAFGQHATQRLRQLCARTVRATPLPGLL